MPPLTRIAPALALMALIFVLSAQPDLSSGLGNWDLVGRKLVHMAEFHQTFVDGRHGTPVDVLIDATGVAIAWALLRAGGGRRLRES